MALKEQIVTITADGRDKGKQYIVTEADPFRTEAWCTRALFAAMNAGVDIPENIASAGLAGVVALGAKALALVPYDTAKPLLDEMLTCVQYKVAGGVTRGLGYDGDIEELSTILQLRKVIVGLHTDFFTDANPSNGGTDPQAVATS